MTAQAEFRFAGPELEPHDRARLGRQLLLVKGLMGDGKWRTLSEIEALTGAPQASISARLRDIRRMGLRVERKRAGPERGTWLYRVEVAS